MIAIGTKVIANDSFTERVGQVADHITNQWGTWHLVLIGGEFQQVGTISPAGTPGIGWRVATDAEIERVKRYADA